MFVLTKSLMHLTSRWMCKTLLQSDLFFIVQDHVL